MKLFRSGEVVALDLSRGRRVMLLILVSMASSMIYIPPYMKLVFYDPLMKALNCTNADLGVLMSAYATTALICYLPSGIVADKFRMRTLNAAGLISTAALTFVFALLPSVGTLMLVFVAMGVTTILVWWGVRFKLVRLISEEESYGRNIGISYGIYGAVGLVCGFLQMGIIGLFGNQFDLAISTTLAVIGGLLLLMGILSIFLVPKFAGEIGSADSSGFNFSMVLTALKMPVVWLCAGTMFFVYFYYTGVAYTTPYLQNVLGASLGVVSFVSIVRTYAVTLISGPIFGVITKRNGSPSKVIIGGSIIVVCGMVCLMLLPHEASFAVVGAIVAILLGFVANGAYGIASSQLSEGKVPISVFGTATGLLSVIGFAPDTFSSTWFGVLIDNHGNAAYSQIFLILAASALLAMLFAAALLLYVRKNKSRLEQVEEHLEETAIDNEAHSQEND